MPLTLTLIKENTHTQPRTHTYTYYTRSAAHALSVRTLQCTIANIVKEERRIFLFGFCFEREHEERTYKFALVCVCVAVFGIVLLHSVSLYIICAREHAHAKYF